MNCEIGVMKERDRCLEMGENRIEQQTQLVDSNAAIKFPSSNGEGSSVQMAFSRPQTVPAKEYRCRLPPPSRQIHTSPASSSFEHLMQNFRAKTQLIIASFEDNDHVLQQSFDDNGSTKKFTFDDKTSDLPMEVFQNKNCHRLLRRKTTFTKKAHLQNGRHQDLPFQHYTRDSLDVNRNRHSPNSSETLEIYHSVSDFHQEKIDANEQKLKESNQRLNELAGNIRLKEAFVQELLKKQKAAVKLNEEYKNKIQEQEKEIDRVQKELNETRQNLQDLESRGHNEESEQRKMYLKVIQDSEIKITALQNQQKETEKVANLMPQNSKKIEDLKLSVMKMKQQHDHLQKRLKDEYGQKLKLERGMQQELHRVKQLEQQNLQQQKILKRKNEEIAKTQRKLRGASLPPINMASQYLSDEKKRWLDSEIDKILEQRERLDDLQQNDTLISNFFDTLNSIEMRSLLEKYFEKVITLNETNRKITQQMHQLEMKLIESQNSLQKVTIDMDHKLAQQQQQYEQKMAALTHQLTQSPKDTNSEKLNSKIHQLEKELYYYKKTSRDLKKKLRHSESKSLDQYDSLENF